MEFKRVSKIALVITFAIASSSVMATKMTSNLERLINDKNTIPNLVLLSSQNSQITRSSSNSTFLQVEISTINLTENDRKSFEMSGVDITAFSTQYNRISLDITDVSQLSTIENISKVIMMQPNHGFITNVGRVTSRALENMNPPLPLPLSLNGTGQKIGIVSDSFARTVDMTGTPGILIPGNSTPIVLTGSPPQLSGDLPASIDLRFDNLRGQATDEGEAMAELIYDIAPGVEIAFHSIGAGEPGFATAIADLCGAAQSTIVVDDVLVFSEPVYQDGIVSQEATKCVNKGIPYFSAAGNSANEAFRQQFKDVNPALNDNALVPTGNDFHDWGNGSGFLKLTLQANSSLRVVLQWNQPFQSMNALKGSEIDLNLYFYATPDLTQPIANISSTNIQAIDGAVVKPFGDAFETVGFTSNAQGIIYLAIDNLRGSLGTIPQDPNTPLEFSLAFFSNGVAIDGIVNNSSQFGGPTIYAHASAQGVVSVAAAAWYNNTQPESFSSLGGNLTVQFDKLGNFNPVTRFVPDITAIDRNNTTFFGQDLPAFLNIPGEPDGFPNFAGTSAAAPNAAAVAALALQKDPTLTPAALTALLKSTATDLTAGRASVGIDPVSGAGLLNVSALLAKINAVDIAPQIAAIPAQTFKIDEQNSFAITAKDNSTFIPVITVNTTINNFVFVDNQNSTATFSWMPSAADVGDYTVTVTATDGNTATPGSDTQVVNIKVVDGTGTTTTTNNKSSSSSGGCSINNSAKIDPLLPSLLFLSLFFLLRKRKKNQSA